MKKFMFVLFVMFFALTGTFLTAGGQDEVVEAEGPKEISWYYAEGGAQVTDEWYGVELMLEDLGIAFTHISPGGSDYLTRLQLLLAAREVPDVITSYGELTTNLIGWGVVAPVNKYVLDEPEKYIPNLVKNLNNWELGVQLMTKPNGNIYGVPATNNASRSTIQYIRQDWLDNLGLKAPTTLDELLVVLRAFTNDDPDGNGKDDTYGTAMNEHWGARVFAIPFGAAVDAYYPNGSEIVMGQYHPRHKEYLKFLAQLVEEGLCNPEIPTLKHPDVKDKLAAGDYGYFWGWTNAGDEKKMQEINPNAVWVPIAPFSGPTYDVGYNDAGGIIREPYLVSYHEDESDYEAIFSMFNWFADDTSTDVANPTFEGTYWIAANGKQGEWWDVRPDGLVDFGQWDTTESQTLKSNKEGIQTNGLKRFRSKFDMAWFLAQPERVAAQFLLIDSFKTVNDIPADDPAVRIRRELVNASLSMEVSDQLAVFLSEQAIVWETMFYSVVLGNTDADSAWDAWMAQAEAAGLSDLMSSVSAEAKAGGVY